MTATHLSILVSTTRGMTSHSGLLIFLTLTATSPPTRPTVFTYLNWWDIPAFAHRSWILYIDFVDFRLLHQGFKSTLLGKSLAKFFKRHDTIIEKNGITLREMRLTIQDWETHRILCYFTSFVSSYRPYLPSIFNMVHARAQFLLTSFARALLI